ncbi:response regulator receiver domain [Muricauda sp. SCSIO 64092]|uniref:response regulator receiver domain n=1 Tax=Allomuricauda sp. SCSIO 64092 TaxID=2908842 RepID=UPI001FF5353A|nr:response regulator receiver domain [Muricauda sp. SCSIO 64092]UOY08308.1 response regulator receiver domain [Muricauda sp. SCSIO 64092]
METPATDTNSYKEKSTRIISEAIKSAVFIDEKAWAPYTEKSEEAVKEETLSEELFTNFKQNKVSLAVHRFEKNDLNNNNIKDYLFDGRDLVLLDWRLDGKTGEEYALEMLSQIVAKPHIHFCCIYTSDEDLDGVFHNILAYFSGETQQFYDDLKLTLSADEEEVMGLLDQIKYISANRHNSSKGQAIGKIFKEHKDLVTRLKKATGTNATDCALIRAGIAFDSLIKSAKKLSCPEVISFDQKVLVIDSTIVVVLYKNYDSDPVKLIDRIANHVFQSQKSFTQLLGLEMQNIFDRCASFVDTNLLEVSKEALLKHRAQLGEEGLKLPFKHFIKEVLFVQANLNLATQDLELLEDDFLDSLYDKNAEVKPEELLAMNVFYNSIQLPGEKKVNFGGVFKREGSEEYYMCITPKSDCLRPSSKIKNSFSFVRGVPMDKKLALSLGDTAFISFLEKKTVVRWTEYDSHASDSEHPYLPVYVKPISITIPEPKYDKDGKIEMLRLNHVGKVERFVGIYTTTIKPNYAQRIANHAFNHPVRVSVDFVKEPNDLKSKPNPNIT